MRKRKPKKTLIDVLFSNMAGTPGPTTRIPKRNAPRSFPRKTGEFFPIRQSKN